MANTTKPSFYQLIDKTLDAVESRLCDERKLTVQYVKSIQKDLELVLHKELRQIALTPGPRGDKGDKGDPADPQAVAEALADSESFLSKARGSKGDKGDKGDAGERGEKGEAGISPSVERIAEALKSNAEAVELLRGKDGEKGEAGEAGTAGEVGPAGRDADPIEVAKHLISDAEFLSKAAGPRGDPGPKGDDGKDADPLTIAAALTEDDTFLQKVVGPRGEKGDRGDKGEKGDVGESGRDADPADVAVLLKSDDGFVEVTRGLTGAKGDRGDKGDPGDKGDKGDTGEPGADADHRVLVGLLKSDEHFKEQIKGDKGDRGEKGDYGAPGKDADPKAVAALIKADEDFATKLIGPKGDKGDTGERGEAGLDRPLLSMYTLAAGDVLPKASIGFWQGSLYQAVRQSKGSPSEDPDGWRLVLRGISSATTRSDPKGRKHSLEIMLGDGTAETVSWSDTAKYITDPSADETRINGDFYFGKDSQGTPTLNFYVDGEYRSYEVQGPKGPQGPDGARGPKGRAGKDGADGVGIEDWFIEDGNFIVILTNGEAKSIPVAELVPQPERQPGEIKRWRGTWMPDKEFLPGDVVNYTGGLYLVERRTSGSTFNVADHSLMMAPPATTTQG